MARTKSLSEVLGGVTRFGRLTVVGEGAPKVAASGFSAKTARVRCDCGVEKVVRAGDLKHGYSHSCGCLQRELTAVKIADRSRTHGQAGKSVRTPEYSAWSSMKRRCSSPRDSNYPRYGGRGITVCDRWRDSFEAFFEDMGPRPSAIHSVERDNRDGNYEPGNCRWATQKEQANNRRSNVEVEAFGETMTVVQWAERLGIDQMIIYQRLAKGWNGERAVSTPKMGKGVRRGTADSARRRRAGL